MESIETKLKIEFETTIMDTFSSEFKLNEKHKEIAIEQHIQDWCEEHGIDRNDVEIIGD